MLQGMLSEGPPEWSVYLLRCADGTYYTGIAKDVAARLAAHNSGRGAAYTRSRRPVELLSSSAGFTRSQALVREAWIKSLPRERKQDGVGLAHADPSSYTGKAMQKRKTSNAKRAKPAAKKKPMPQEADPELDQLQERFNTMSVDFGQLAELIEEEKPA